MINIIIMNSEFWLHTNFISVAGLVLFFLLLALFIYDTIQKRKNELTVTNIREAGNELDLDVMGKFKIRSSLYVLFVLVATILIVNKFVWSYFIPQTNACPQEEKEEAIVYEISLEPEQSIKNIKSIKALKFFYREKFSDPLKPATFTRNDYGDMFRAEIKGLSNEEIRNIIVEDTVNHMRWYAEKVSVFNRQITLKQDSSNLIK